MAKFLYDERFYKFSKSLVNIVLKMYFANKIKVTFKEKIPEESLILCSNHVSNLDPLIIVTTIERRLNFMAKKELFKFKPLAYLLEKDGAYLVDREKPSKKTLGYSLYLLKNNEILYIFPEGTRRQNFEGLKEGIAWLYLTYERQAGKKLNILPVGISYEKRLKISKNKSFPCPFSNVYINYGNLLDIKLKDNISRKAKRVGITLQLEEKINELIQ